MCVWLLLLFFFFGRLCKKSDNECFQDMCPQSPQLRAPPVILVHPIFNFLNLKVKYLKKLIFCIEVQKMMFFFINIIIIITFKILKWR
jgi:hypothetical protein